MPAHESVSSVTLNKPILFPSGRSVRPLKLINHSAHGDIYLVRQLLTNKFYALKSIPRSADQEIEVQLHQRMSSHPNILTLHETLITPNHALLLLDYCQQGDLFEAITSGKIADHPDSENVIRSIFLQLCWAVSCCHEAGIYHRDIKPENIFVTFRGDGPLVQLGDFGLAVDAENPEALISCGSPCFMPPDAYPDFEYDYEPSKADVWALGVILCNLLTAKNPWKEARQGDVRFDFIQQDVKRGLVSILGLYHEVAEMLAYVLQQDPRQRCGVEELMDAFGWVNFSAKQQECGLKKKNELWECELPCEWV